MNYKQRLAVIAAASIVTMAFIYLFDSFLSLRLFASLQQELGYRAGLLASMGLSIAFNVVASTPGMLLMKYLRVPRFVALSVLGVFEGFWISYVMTAVVVSLVGWWAWLPTSFLSLFLGYVLADLVLNVWQATPKRRAVVAVALAVVTMVVANLVPILITRL